MEAGAAPGPHIHRYLLAKPRSPPSGLRTKAQAQEFTRRTGWEYRRGWRSSENMKQELDAGGQEGRGNSAELGHTKRDSVPSSGAVRGAAWGQRDSGLSISPTV